MKCFTLSFRYAFFLAAVSAVSSSLYAQHAITPSLSGSFFDDARARSYDLRSLRSEGSEQGASSYRFHRGYYRDVDPARSGNESVANSGGESSAQHAGLGTPYPGGNLYSHSQRYGREFGRYSSGSFNRGSMFAPASLSGAYPHDYYNFKVGSIPFVLSLGADLEFNDNVTRAPSGQEFEETILGARLGINADYQLTKHNRISISTSLGWDHYFDNPQVNPYGDEDFSLHIAEGSNITFDLFIGEMLFTFYERFSISRLTTDDFALDDLDIFSSFQNHAGVVMSWAVNSSTNLSLSYDRGDNIAIDDDYSQLDRGTNSLLASLAWSPTGIWVLGLNASASQVDYDENLQNDGDTYNVGLFVSTPISTNTSIRAGIGSQIYEFNSGGLNQDRSDLDDYYYNIAIQNQLNARLSHSLTFGHESSLGTRSNYITSDYVRYGLGLVGYKGSRFSASVFVEEESASASVTSEDFSRYGIDLYWGHQLTGLLHGGLGYHYGDTDSSLARRDYVQQSVSVDLSYPLTEKLLVAGGYRFWTVDADDSGSNFDQNRLIFSANYRF